MILNDSEQIGTLVKNLRKGVRGIITVGGCFDILHIGHIRLLQWASLFDGWIWVLTNTDQSLSKLKPGRPINPLPKRQEVLNALKGVDYVSSFDEDTPCELLKLLSPDIHIKGSEYKTIKIPEQDLVPQYIKRIEYFSMVPEESTTRIVDRLRNGRATDI